MATLYDEVGDEYDIPDHEVDAAVKDGLKPASGRTVKLIGPDDEHYEMPAEAAPAAIRDGFKTSKVEDVRSGIEAAARGVSAGLSDASQAVMAGINPSKLYHLADDALGGALENTRSVLSGDGFKAPTAGLLGKAADVVTGKESLGDVAREYHDVDATKAQYADIKDRQARLGGVGTGIEMAAGLGTALLSGGVSTAASAARMSPVAAINSLAARAAEAIAPKAGMIGKAALSGAIENATTGASRRVIDGLMNDHEWSAERMLEGAAGVVEDAGIGALAGALPGGLIKGSQLAVDAAKGAGRKIAGKLGQTIAENVPQQFNFDLSIDPLLAVDSVGPLTTREIGQVADGMTGGKMDEVLRAARGAADSFGDTQQGAVRSIGADMADLAKMSDAIDVDAGIAAKNLWAKRLSPEQGMQAMWESEAQLANVRSSLKAMREGTSEAALQDMGGLSTLDRMQKLTDQTEEMVKKHMRAGNYGDALIEMDGYKRMLGKAQNTKNSAVAQRMRGEYENIRRSLENEEVFGDFAKVQKPVNKAWTERIRAENDSDVGRFWQRGSEASADPFEVLDKPNLRSIGAHLNELGSAESEGTEIALRKYMRNLAVDAQHRASAWGTPELQEKAAAISALTKRVEDTMNAVGFAKKDADAWKKAGETVRDLQVPLLGAALNAAGGAVRVAGSAIGKMAQKAVPVEAAVEQASKDAVRVMLEGKAARAGAVAGNLAGIAKRAIDQARELEDDQSAASARMRLLHQELAADDPQFADVVIGKMKDRAAFLRDKAGPATDDTDPLNPGAAPLKSRPEQAKLARYAAAVTDPAKAIQRIGNGHGSAEDLETMQTMYPRLYQDFVERTAKAVETGKHKPTMRQRAALQRATGVPASKLSDPESVQWMQNLAKLPLPGSDEGMGGGGKMNFNAEQSSSRSDALLNGE